MTGPEHYREAERLLDESKIAPGQRAERGWRTSDELVAAAQVHATLALAAAQALQPVTAFMGDSGAVTDWGRVVGHEQVAPAVTS